MMFNNNESIRITTQASNGNVHAFSTKSNKKVATVAAAATACFADTKDVITNILFGIQGHEVADIEVNLDAAGKPQIVAKVKATTIAVPVKDAKVASIAPAARAAVLEATLLSGGTLRQKQVARLEADKAAGFTPRIPVLGRTR